VVEGDVFHFVPVDFLADVFDERIVYVFSEEGVVDFGDEFGDEEDLDVELEIDDGAEAAEDGVGPLFLEADSVEVVDEMFEEAGVFVFFIDEEFDSVFVLGVAAGRGDFAGELEEAGAAAGFAELEDGDGVGEGFSVGGVGDAAGLGPVGVLVGVFALGEVVDPTSGVHGWWRLAVSG
jgi:hypothetical protein